MMCHKYIWALILQTLMHMLNIMSVSRPTELSVKLSIGLTVRLGAWIALR